MWRHDQAVAGGHLAHVEGIDAACDLLGQQVLLGWSRAVDELPKPEQHKPLFDRGSIERDVERDHRVGQNVDESGFSQIVDQPVDIGAPRLDLDVVGRGQPVDQNVDRVTVFGRDGGDLFAGEELGFVRERQRPVDRLVVGEGDDVHPGLLRHPVGVLRRGLELSRFEPEPQALHPPVRRRPRGIGMQVQIDVHRGVVLESATPELMAATPASFLCPCPDAGGRAAARLPTIGHDDDSRGDVGVVKRIAENAPARVNALSTSQER
jgi:hypothetical protein